MVGNSILKTHFIDQSLCYDGSQLSPHWIYRNHHLLGDSLVGFLGPARLSLDQMVDLADVKDQAPIFSENMLHFIYESFGVSLELMVTRQRLFICVIAEVLTKDFQVQSVVRKGDDLFINDKKLSVSIATKSLTSCLMHTGLNVSSQNTPVATIGLSDLNIKSKALYESISSAFTCELEGVANATCKVRGV